MKKTMRKAMISTICMLVVAVMSLTGVTYAWFTAGTQATVNGMNVVVTAAAGGVQVRLKDTATWQSTLNLGVAQTDVEPVSSKDGVNFFALGEMNPENTNQAKVISVNKEDNDNIIVKEIELSNPGQSNITVDLEGSSIVAATNGVENEIYKAARVALIVSGAGNDTTYVYAAGVDTWYAFEATSDEFVNLGAAVAGVATSQTTKAVDACTITLPANPDNADAEKIVNVEIVIWLEGQDSDCKNANAAGAFDIVLNFKDIAAE